MGRKKKDQKLVQAELHLITPKENKDIVDMCEMLQEKATSIIVDFRNVKGDKKVIQKVLDYLDLYSTSYCTIKYKRITNTVYVVYSVFTLLL